MGYQVLNRGECKIVSFFIMNILPLITMAAEEDLITAISVLSFDENVESFEEDIPIEEHHTTIGFMVTPEGHIKQHRICRCMIGQLFGQQDIKFIKVVNNGKQTVVSYVANNSKGINYPVSNFTNQTIHGLVYLCYRYDDMTLDELRSLLR